MIASQYWYDPTLWEKNWVFLSPLVGLTGKQTKYEHNSEFLKFSTGLDFTWFNINAYYYSVTNEFQPILRNKAYF